MSDNATTAVIVIAVLGSVTLCSLFGAWRDRGVAKYGVVERSADTMDPDANRASVSTTNERPGQ